MAINLLELDGILIEILRKPVKNISLRIYPPDGRVTVSVPLKTRLDFICKQLEAKRDWIHKQRAHFQTQALTIIPKASYESGEEHSFMGKNYPLLFLKTSQQKQVILKDDLIHCFSKSDLTLVERQKLLENWYRQQMKEQLPELIAKWEAIIGVSVSGWSIKVMKTRWGSCNPVSRHICLNLSLIKKPLICLEYVIVHELVHLLEASHNKRFYAFMDRYLPQWQNIKSML